MTEDLSTPGMAQPSQESGFLTILGNVFVAPAEAFKALASRPIWLAPLLLSVGLGIAFAAVYLAKADPLEVTRARVEAGPQAAKMEPAQREAMIAMQAKALKPIGWGLAVLGSPLWFTLAGLYFMVVFRFVYGASLSFRQAFSIVAIVSLATGLVQTALLLLTFWLKGDWNIPPELVLQTSPALFLDRADTKMWLFALVSSLDLFTIWRLSLYAIGFGIVTRRTTGSASWAGIIPWVVFSLAGAALAAIFA
jgi:hypothetical protein